MDYIPGDDLRAVIAKAEANKQFLNEADVIDWAMQIGDALSYLHSQNPAILHRDIKPSNIKVTPAGGVVKLVDFGLVKLLAPGEVTITIMQGARHRALFALGTIRRRLEHDGRPR